MSDETLKNLLMATSHEKLVHILLSLHSNNQDMRKQLDIIFAGLDDDPKKIVSMIEKEIGSLKRSTKFVGFHESESLANRLNDLRLRIAKDLNGKSPQTAFTMMLEFLDLQKNTLERVDDSGGTVGEVFVSACADLGSLAQNTNHGNQELVEIVLARFIDNGYCIYDKIIHNFKEALKNDGLDLLQTKLEQTANEKNIDVFDGLKSIADCKNDVDLYIRVCTKDGIHSHDHLEIAKRLIKHSRASEALKWLDTMVIPPSNLQWQRDRKELKIKALELDGHHSEAQKEQLSLFTETLCPKLYEDILNKSEHNLKEAFKSDAIKQAFQFKDPHTALGFLVKIHVLDEVAKFVQARFKELNGREYRTLRPIADLLQNTNPLAATLLYRRMIESILEETKSRYYYFAAKDLITCAGLNSKIRNWKAFQRHSEYFKEIEIKHKRKHSFWSEYKSVLQKQAS